MSSGKVLVINSWWAGIFSTLLVTAIVGGFTFYVETKTALAAVQENRKSIEKQLDDIENKIDRIWDKMELRR